MMNAILVILNEVKHLVFETLRQGRQQRDPLLMLLATGRRHGWRDRARLRENSFSKSLYSAGKGTSETCTVRV